ncbi:precorrin-6y C5,15-methyltransferase (decarboxylating) subunit CbiE [Desulfuribacillus alkaliarsenatis]|uniref:Precorrin-6y C5,15-methyltransferase (Decarboxylating) subunit CbiE n=2 Tax=Desulfuribacillus alkaliarsenatis TaxID=766136 RepID=A0A1E5G4H2_9FIRM|nr:precorrin-6y C5,15-methyltransferase (decarboxylating) subunit CbiE [Desulfuribacillus alkaliarsenatis]
MEKQQSTSQRKIKVVGTGPGAVEYITPIAKQAIEQADVVVGAKRLLEAFAVPGQQQLIVDKELLNVVTQMKNLQKLNNITVLVSGDTGIFSFANYLTKHFQAKELVFIPGISSVQVMFARLQRPWVEAQIISMHGRTEAGLVDIIQGAKVTAMVTGTPWTPQTIAKKLLDSLAMEIVACDWRVAIGKDLTYAHEQIINTTIGTLVDDKNDYSNSVMVIWNDSQ